jgi:hypothetical protein
MNAFAFVCSVIAALAVAPSDAKWSEPVSGLRGRLIVERAKEPDSPFCRVFIELENVDDVAGQKRIRFQLERLSLRVVDKDGKALPPPTEVHYDGSKPNWEPIALPMEGAIKFRVSFAGLGYRPNVDTTIVDIDGTQVWVIPQTGGPYYLSGSFTIAKEKGDRTYSDWSGTLNFPNAEIPAAEK